VTIALESHVARLQASVATIAITSAPTIWTAGPCCATRFFVLDHMYMSVFATCGWILRLAVVTIALLGVDSPGAGPAGGHSRFRGVESTWRRRSSARAGT